jgi:hypothetical protein
LRTDTANAVENRFPMWRSGSATRLGFLSVRLLHASEQCNVVVAQNVDVANANKLIITNVVATIAVAATPAAAATAVTPAGGDEIEFLIRQLDWVSEIGHLLHVSLLSIFNVGGRMFVVTAAMSLLAA